MFRRAWWPYQARLGLVEGLCGYHAVTSYPEAQQLDGLVLYRFDAPMFFANARTFRDEIRKLAKADPRPRWIVIAAEPITDIDTTAADVLEELNTALTQQGISLVFAELKDPVRRRLEDSEPDQPLPADRFFPTLNGAVEAFRAETGGQWHAPTSNF